MNKARKDLERRQLLRDSLLTREKEQQATREWWKTPSSSSTLAWVHSGGARGTSSGEVRPWNCSNNVNESMMVHKADSTVNLNSTAEEMEVLDLDQNLMEEEPEPKQMEEDTATPHTQAQGKDKEGKTSP